MRSPDPVVFLEPKSIYRAFREEVPEDEEIMPIGESQVAREGDDITLIAYGAMMRPTLEAAERLAEEDGVEAEVIDLLTLSPLDDAKFTASARKTGRVVVVHEAKRSYGPGAEVVARLNEKSFWYLEAPINRVAGYDIIFPLFAREKAYLPDADRILRAARETLAVRS
jgi:pyruvate dehydrogenase E1 component beta subunit